MYLDNDCCDGVLGRKAPDVHNVMQISLIAFGSVFFFCIYDSLTFLSIDDRFCWLTTWRFACQWWIPVMGIAHNPKTQASVFIQCSLFPFLRHGEGWLAFAIICGISHCDWRLVKCSSSTCWMCFGFLGMYWHAFVPFSFERIRMLLPRHGQFVVGVPRWYQTWYFLYVFFVVALYFSNVIVFFGQRNAISMLNHGCERGMHSFALLF